jgi:hypothetical protein
VLDARFDLGLVRRRRLGPTQAHHLPATDTLELEDLEHGDHIDARRQRPRQAEGHEGGPDEVEVAVVVAVGHEPKGERHAGEDERPAV